MKSLVAIAIALGVGLFAAHTHGFECENSGAAPATAPNDTGDGDATACGNSALASGDKSTALGNLATATGARSVALGDGAVALSTAGVGIGDSALASNSFDLAAGFEANATGGRSISVGYQSGASGNQSIAIGLSADAEIENSIAIGSMAIASGQEGIALGRIAQASGVVSIAIGSDARAEGAFSVALGRSKAEGNVSVALGEAAATTEAYTVALGANAKAVGIFSTAIGAFASAPNPYTMVLGSVPGENDPLNQNAFINIANGTVTPFAPLHIFRDDPTQNFLFLESDEPGVNQDRAMMDLANNGGIRFQFTNNTLGTAWRFQAATGNQDSFEVTKVGSGSIEFKVDASGNATLAGLLFENSDVDAKTNIERIDPGDVLARVAKLPISEWEYKDTPGQRHVGPMAQDFYAAFGLGANNTSLATIDTSGVALASIQALNLKLEQKVAALENKNRRLERMLQGMQGLASRVALLESAAAQ